MLAIQLGSLELYPPGSVTSNLIGRITRVLGLASCPRHLAGLPKTVRASSLGADFIAGLG